MSLDAGISVEIEKSSAFDVIDCFVTQGLEIYDPQGQIHLITENACDGYMWGELSITYSELKKYIYHRQLQGYPIAISLWKNGERITNLLVESSNRVIFNCDINRKALMSSGSYIFTDVNWYLENIVMLLSNRFKILSLEYREIR